jgi:hypothetical protein
MAKKITIRASNKNSFIKRLYLGYRLLGYFIYSWLDAANGSNGLRSNRPQQQHGLKKTD